jgi:hypothetical protein
LLFARRDVIRDADVKRRGSGATVDARAMGIVIRSLGLFGLLFLRIYWVLVMLIGLNVFVIKTKLYTSNIEAMTSNIGQEHLPIISLFMTDVRENNLKSIAIVSTSINITRPDPILRLLKINSI